MSWVDPDQSGEPAQLRHLTQSPGASWPQTPPTRHCRLTRDVTALKLEQRRRPLRVIRSRLLLFFVDSKNASIPAPVTFTKRACLL